MASLTIGNGSKHLAEDGSVQLDGNTVGLYGPIKAGIGKNVAKKQVLYIGYCLKPGETVCRIGEGEDYVVEF